MEVGRKIGLPLEGISFPGHFLVRLGLRGSTLVLDPFSGGAPLSEEDLRKLLRRVIAESGRAGLRAAGDVAAELPLDQFLEPAGHRQVLARMLRNLKNIYREKDQPQQLLKVINRMIAVSPEAHGELRDRGLVYQQLEAFRAALKDLNDYLERDPEALDADDIRARVVELTSLCARLN
jgi:regulator of sirC expression with transglutaminase-like and TPR domain